MSDSQRRPRRRLRKALIATPVLAAMLAAVAALAPTLVTWGVGQGFIRSTLERRVNGTVSLGDVELGWFGPQSVTGFEIHSPDGATAVQVDVTLDAGLLDLALGRVEALAIELSGSVHGELRQDGSTSIDDLLSRAARATAPAGGNGGQPLRLPAMTSVPPTTVVLAGLDITLAEQGATHRIIRLNDLTGELRYAPGDQVKLHLAGQIGDGVSAGTVTVDGHMTGLYDARGAVTPARASGRLEILLRNAPVPLTDRPTELGLMNLVATTDDPTQRVSVTVQANATIDGTPSGRLEGALAVDNPIDESGVVSLRLDQVTGRLIGESMPTVLLQRALRGTPFVAARDLGPVMDVTADFSTGTTRRVIVLAAADAATLDFEGTVDGAHRITAQRCIIEATLRPELVREMTGVRIERDAAIIVKLDTLERDTELAAKGTVRLREPVMVSDGPGAPLLRDLLDETLVVAVEATYGQGRLWAKLGAEGDGLVAHGTATLQDQTLDVVEAVARLRMTPALFAALQDSAEPFVLAAPVSVTLQLSPVALAMGSPGTAALRPPIRALVGLSDAALAGVPVFGELGIAGDFRVTLDGELIAIDAEGIGVTLPRAALQQRMGDEIKVVADVPMKLTIRSLRLPRAALSGKAFDGADADIDLLLVGGPVVLEDPRVGRNTVKDIRVTVVGGDLGAALTTKLTGDIEFAGAPEPGRLQLDGTVTNLMTDRMLTASRATLVMAAKVDGLHTAVIDGLADMQGLLVAAMGSRVDVVATADDFSRNSGTLQTRIEATNGWLDGKAAGRDNALVVDPDAPVKAELELTPPLRQRLLYKIHPVLADIRSMEQPMRATIGASSIPLDGDVGRLDSKVEITVGKVEIDSGSKALTLLTLAQATDAGTLKGEIHPIRATISKGIVTYDEPFVVEIDKYTFIYTGTIDLNRRYVDLVTNVPLEGLAGTFRELKGYTGDATIKMYYRGPFGDVRAEIDPDRLAAAAAEVGIRKGLGELEKEIGVPIGEIFDGLFGKKKK